MPLALEITLIAVLVAIAAALVPLLFQMRRTAQGMEAFLQSSKKDLAQIAEDVHASRLRMDDLVASLQISVDELLGFMSSIAEVGRTVNDFHDRFRTTLESASRTLGGLIGGAGSVLAFFKRRHTTHEHSQENQP